MRCIRLAFSTFLFAVSVITITSARTPASAAESAGCIYQGQSYAVNAQVCISHMVFTCEEAQQIGSEPASFAWQDVSGASC